MMLLKEMIGKGFHNLGLSKHLKNAQHFYSSEKCTLKFTRMTKFLKLTPPPSKYWEGCRAGGDAKWNHHTGKQLDGFLKLH